MSFTYAKWKAQAINFDFGFPLGPGAQVPEHLTKFSLKRGSSAKKMNSAENTETNPVERAKAQFQIAAKAGSDLGLKWLQRLEEEENRLLAESHSNEPSSQN